MDKKKFLPLGSAVMLKDATRPLIIIGYTIMEKGSDKIWDYLGCAYPIGVVDPERNLLFQKDQIDKVLSLGYQDDEGKKFIDQMEEAVKKLQDSQK